MMMYKIVKSKIVKIKYILQNNFNNFVKYVINEGFLKIFNSDK